MRLTNFSNCAMCILMVASVRADRPDHHRGDRRRLRDLVRASDKVVNQLTRAGFLKAVRGRSGGLTLTKPPGQINLGDVLRATEPDFTLVECFTADNQCMLTPRCRLRGVLHEALSAFIATVERHTLAGLVLSPANFGLQRAA